MALVNMKLNDNLGLRKWLFAVIVLAVFCLHYIYSGTGSQANHERTMKPLPNTIKDTGPPTSMPIYQHIQDGRIRHIHEVCSDKSTVSNRKYNASKSHWVQTKSPNTITYCLVPKVGSTFLTQMLMLMENGIDSASTIFGQKRSTVHAKYSASHVDLPRRSNNTSHTVLVSRDPYSRLYSAFVDKMYLPLMYSVTAHIAHTASVDFLTGKHVSNCGNHVTFQQFLNYIVVEAESGKVLNPHWAPIVSLCQPCDTKYPATLIKQETFAEDVEGLLGELNVETEMYNAIVDRLFDHRPDATIPGIISTVLSRYRGRVAECLTAKQVVERIWISFQIQGYVDENNPFAETRFPTVDKQRNASYVSGVILETVKGSPLSAIESKAQRHRALVGAYSKVDTRTIEAIRQVFKQDFAVFNYDMEPPS